MNSRSENTEEIAELCRRNQDVSTSSWMSRYMGEVRLRMSRCMHAGLTLIHVSCKTQDESIGKVHVSIHAVI